MIEEFLSAAVLHYDGQDGPERRRRAAELLGGHPGLPTLDVYAAAAAADPAAIAAHLSDPEAANRAGGPLDWPPLMYLAYSRVPPASAEAAERSLRLLLDAGADPNAGYLNQGLEPPFTVLTGLFGNGELGEPACPSHPYADRLAPILLAAGADPNDGQALYNRMFGGSNDHLDLLLAYGLGRGDEGAALLRAQLIWAISHGMVERIRLLAAHGVDLDAPLTGLPLPGSSELRPVQLALQTGQVAMAALLAELGAQPATDPVSTLVGALLSADPTAREADPALIEQVRRERPSLVLRATVLDRPDAVRLLVGLGFDVNAYGRQDLAIEQPWETALHHAAGEGRLAVARTLLELGADATLRDRRFGATPQEWAEHFGRPALVQLLAGNR